MALTLATSSRGVQVDVSAPGIAALFAGVSRVTGITAACNVCYNKNVVAWNIDK